jgi:Arc/MetJ-type ribon-helix-helix transcriptional regulator
MSRSGKISVALPRHQIAQVRQIVEAGEYTSAASVIREALRSWLQRRTGHAGAHGSTRLSRSMRDRIASPSEPRERVDLLFDATDAKA